MILNPLNRYWWMALLSISAPYHESAAKWTICGALLITAFNKEPMSVYLPACTRILHVSRIDTTDIYVGTKWLGYTYNQEQWSLQSPPNRTLIHQFQLLINLWCDTKRAMSPGACRTDGWQNALGWGIMVILVVRPCCGTIQTHSERVIKFHLDKRHN